MGAEFLVQQYYNIGGVSCVVAGCVESGKIIEGCIGVTSRSKRFTVVKIEREGSPLRQAEKGDKVNLSVKHLSREDVTIGETFRF